MNATFSCCAKAASASCDPVTPVKRGENALTYWSIFAGSSRSGSTETK